MPFYISKQDVLRRTVRLSAAILCLSMGVSPSGQATTFHKAGSYERFYGSVGDPGCKRSVPGVCWKHYTAWFAIPPCMVNAESHGLLNEHSHPYGSSGLYQLQLSNWDHWKLRGWPAFPYQGTKHEQDIVATDVLRSQGIHAWSTAAGCGY